MVGRRIRLGAGGLIVFGLLTAGCSGGADDPAGSSPAGSSSGPTGDAVVDIVPTTPAWTPDPNADEGILQASITEPGSSLLPSAIVDTEGGRVADLIFAGLVYYDAAGNPVNEVAQSIETTDSQTYTISLVPGRSFTDGSPVKADSFVKAWSFAANIANDQPSHSAFASIQGYEDLRAMAETEERDADDNPVTAPVAAPDAILSGLSVVDDTTFTVQLTRPESDFPLRLGSPAYFPLPDAAYDDIEAFGQSPIGNGPYKLSGPDAWEHEASISLVPNPDYQGPRASQNSGVHFIVYASSDAAYADLLIDQLDIVDELPDSALATFEADLGDRAVNQPGARVESITIPSRLDHFSGEEGRLRRAALSRAIDRADVLTNVLHGTRTPATDFTSPIIAGWKAGLTGAEVLTYDEAAAKDLWAQADAISTWGEDAAFVIAYNADGPHGAWVDAVAASIGRTLGIEARGEPYPNLAALNTAITDGSITTAYRQGWQPEYPSQYAYLAPQYGTDGSANAGGYSASAVDDALAAALAASSLEDAAAAIATAQEALLVDLPAIPLWYDNSVGASSERTGPVTFGWNGVPVYYSVFE